MNESGFGTIDIQAVTQTITFPCVLDFVRFQLLATPMTTLLDGKAEPERERIISMVASKTTTLSAPKMLEAGKFTFTQEAYVAVARRSRDVG